MKMKFLQWAVALVLGCVCLTSCLDDDDDNNTLLYNAVVTVVPKDNSCYFVLNDSSLLFPINLDRKPYGDREIRAFINFNEPSKEEEANEDVSSTGPKIHVNWIDSIRTKDMAPDLGVKNDSVYGNDAIDIMRDWATVCEDGYLTLRVRNYYTGREPHVLNLVRGEKPFEVVLHHDAKNDYAGPWAYGVIAFNLNELDETDKPVDLTLRWKSFEGDKSITFKYVPRVR